MHTVCVQRDESAEIVASMLPHPQATPDFFSQLWRKIEIKSAWEWPRDEATEIADGGKL